MCDRQNEAMVHTCFLTPAALSHWAADRIGHLGLDLLIDPVTD